MKAKKIDNLNLRQALKKVTNGFGFNQQIIQGFEKLDQKLTLSSMTADEKEIFFINFFRAVYSRLAKKFNLKVDWSDKVIIPKQIKKELAAIPAIDKHYFTEIEKLQQDMLTNL